VRRRQCTMVFALYTHTHSCVRVSGSVVGRLPLERALQADGVGGGVGGGRCEHGSRSSVRTSMNTGAAAAAASGVSLLPLQADEVRWWVGGGEMIVVEHEAQQHHLMLVTASPSRTATAD
jgi:hypothetical protein